MSSRFWKKFVKFCLKICKTKVSDHFKMDKQQFISLKKNVILDNFSGHDDTIECKKKPIKGMWNDLLKKNWKEKRIPPNSSDYTQPEDLFFNSEYKRIYKIFSKNYYEKIPKTDKGKFQQPGIEKLVLWHSETFRKCSIDSVIKSFERGGFSKGKVGAYKDLLKVTHSID